MSKIQSINPATDEIVGAVSCSSTDEVNASYKSARRALTDWRYRPVSERVVGVESLLQRIKANEQELVNLVTLETGKTVTQSQSEFDGTIAKVQWLLDVASESLAPETLDISDTQITKMYKEPYGVIAAIAPWNFPISQFMHNTVQNVLCGNTVVFKHSEECALVGELLEKIVAESDLPSGVITFVHGDGHVGQILIGQNIDKLCFTGSSKVGMELYKQASERFIPVTFELGGSSPGIIFEDADLNIVLNDACKERFNACGQVCCALKRLIVHESIFEEVASRLAEKIESLVVGDPTKPSTEIGPLVAKRQQEALSDQVENALESGAKALVGGEPVQGMSGAFFSPTLLTNVTTDMAVWQEEVFGPVLPMISFSTEEEAVELANDTAYGLSAFVYSSDQERALRVARRIDAGQVATNATSYFSANASFGGFKKSGIGRHRGRYGFYEATQPKVISEPV